MRTTILILLTLAAIASTLPQSKTQCGITLVHFLGIDQEDRARFQPTPELINAIFQQEAVVIPGIRHRLGSPIRLEKQSGLRKKASIDRILSGSVEKWMDSVLITWVWTDAHSGEVQKVYSAPYAFNSEDIAQLLEQSLRDFDRAAYTPETHVNVHEHVSE